MRCNICESDSSVLFKSDNRHGQRLLSKGNFNVCECKKCKIVFTDVNVNDNYYNRYYLEDYYHDGGYSFIINKILFFCIKYSFLEKLRLIKRYKAEGSNILEIGCGKGDFLNRLPKYFNKYAVEINQKACEYIRKYYKDIIVYDKEIDASFLKDKRNFYDLIVMRQSFEHINNPKIFLNSLAQLLKKDGVLILEVPNQRSLGFRLTKKYWFHLDTPRHLFHYNYQSLQQLLKKCNFKIVNFRSSIFDYPQDLSRSLCAKYKTKNVFFNIVSLILIVPSSLMVRLFLALFVPKLAELNVYVVKNN